MHVHKETGRSFLPVSLDLALVEKPLLGRSEIPSAMVDQTNLSRTTDRQGIRDMPIPITSLAASVVRGEHARVRTASVDVVVHETTDTLGDTEVTGFLGP